MQTRDGMKILARVAVPAAMALAMLGAPAQAATCVKTGGWGTGMMEGFASFMAEAAMKNSAKAKLGADTVKIGAVRKKCEVKGLLYECTAFAQVCK
jgi:hypothetical protein